MLFDAAFTSEMDELLDERTDENFLLLADAGKQDKLLSLTAQLYDFLMALPKPFAWLDEHVEQLSAAYAAAVGGNARKCGEIAGGSDG